MLLPPAVTHLDIIILMVQRSCKQRKETVLIL